jgi:SET domain-containing protein 6
LLRGFGFVDYVPLPAHLFGENKIGNPGDIVEIRADVVLEQARRTRNDGIQDANLHERIDWWLEEGGDEYACILLGLSMVTD